MATALACPDFAPRRGRARLRVGVSAAIATMNGRQGITLLNLSESGALLRVKDSAPFDRGVLKWVNYEAFGVVAWRKGSDVGLRFDEPIDRAWLLDTRERLPALSKGHDEFRQFASDWATGGAGHGPRTPVSASHRRASATSETDDLRTQRASVADWVRAGWPFMAGAALMGAVLGISSSYY